MLESLIAFFRGAKFASLSGYLSALAPILADLEANYANDKDAKNAAIDTMVQLLQAHKD